MLELLLPLLLYSNLVSSQNLVIDIPTHTIQRLAKSMEPYFEAQLPTVELGEMFHSKLLCSMELYGAKVDQVKFGEFGLTMADMNDYYLNMSDISLTISGPYTRSFLFFRFDNTYSADITISAISLGPIIPTFSSGLPFIDSSIDCDIKVKEISKPTTAGWFSTTLIRNALIENIREQICHSMVSVLDEQIRQWIPMLGVTFPVVQNSSFLSYRTYTRPPTILPTNTIRYFIDGLSDREIVRGSSYFQPKDVFLITKKDMIDDKRKDKDIAYHISQQLLNEISEAICVQGYFNTKFTSQTYQNISYDCLTTTVTIQESKHSQIILTISSTETYDGHPKSVTRSFFVRPVHNERDHEILIRFKSEIAEHANDDSFKHQLHSHLTDTLNSTLRLPLPYIQHSSISDVSFNRNTGYITCLANIQFDTLS